MLLKRRSLLKMLGLGTGAVMANPIMSAFANVLPNSQDRFIIIHAIGGWDVTLWSDPRPAPVGIVTPATTANVTTAGLKYWGQGVQMAPTVTKGGIVLGPTIGNLDQYIEAGRVTIFNGIAMNTVSHPDGTYFSATGRHLAGGRPQQTSIDSVVTSETGPGDLFPLMSVSFPSTFIEESLDARAKPLLVADITSVGKSLNRSETFTTAADRAAVTMLLEEEAGDLAAQAYHRGPLEGFGLQLASLQAALSNKPPAGQPSIVDLFDANQIKTGYGKAFFAQPWAFQEAAAQSAAFAVQALSTGLSRCVSFGAQGFDTHVADSYEDAALNHQELFNLLALLVGQLDAKGIADKTHILVVSDFCRHPTINSKGGRDHYPNNSALVISPKFKGGVFGRSDEGQLLPTTFDPLGRQMTPADILHTFAASVGIDPHKYYREGEVIPGVLK